MMPDKKRGLRLNRDDIKQGVDNYPLYFTNGLLCHATTGIPWPAGC